MSAQVHQCSCGRSYTADEWRRLVFVGVQESPADGDLPAERLELRLCSNRLANGRLCNSSRAVRVEAYDMELGAWALAAAVP